MTLRRTGLVSSWIISFCFVAHASREFPTAISTDGFQFLSITARYKIRPSDQNYVRNVQVNGIGISTPDPGTYAHRYSFEFHVPAANNEQHDINDILQYLYEKKLGQLGCWWIGSNDDKLIPMDYSYAKIKLGDVIDFYTNSDGELRFPPWTTFKYVVDQYLDEDPRIKYHPSRVRQFIDENGIEMLESM